MAGVDVHDDVGQVKALEGVGDALPVGAFALLARRQAGVGDQVGQRVGLDQEGKGRVGVGLEDCDDGCEGRSELVLIL